MLHRCLLAQTGASWLKLAKTRILAKIALLIGYTDIDIAILIELPWWLSGRVLLSLSRGRGFKSHSILCVFSVFFS